MSQSLSPRYFLKSSIQKILKPFERDISCYGSFSVGDFHLDERNWRSYSDLDLYCRIPKSSDWRASIARTIKSEILLSTGIHIPVSIRPSRIHVGTIAQDASSYIAQLECLVKLSTNFDSCHLSYQIAKLVLRVVGYSICYDRPLEPKYFFSTNLSTELVKILIDSKLYLTDELNCKTIAAVLDYLKQYHPSLNLFILSLTEKGDIYDLAQQMWLHAPRILSKYPEILEDLEAKLEGHHLIDKQLAIEYTGAEATGLKLGAYVF